uniref:Uncharacterized protein n=1 Tax=Siphoviridae sp. ctYh54 TaxID=2826379 RepID=A0A8S5ME01_9CAUD|nr:MAG TPA: hypothetical protein [Siphoviridae sp. ctYh54]
MVRLSPCEKDFNNSLNCIIMQFKHWNIIYYLIFKASDHEAFLF